jgi:hypothetical protein
VDKENVVYIHNGKLFSYKEEIMSFAGKWMGLVIIKLSEINQTEKGKYWMFFLICEIQT